MCCLSIGGPRKYECVRLSAPSPTGIVLLWHNFAIEFVCFCFPHQFYASPSAPRFNCLLSSSHLARVSLVGCMLYPHKFLPNAMTNTNNNNNKMKIAMIKLNNIAQCVVQAQPKSEKSHTRPQYKRTDMLWLSLRSVNIAYAVHICVHSLSAALLAHILMIPLPLSARYRLACMARGFHRIRSTSKCWCATVSDCLCITKSLSDLSFCSVSFLLVAILSTMV